MAIAGPLDVEAIVGLMCQSIEHTHSKRYPDALACLDAGLRIDAGFFPCRVARAKVLGEMERFDEALADLNYVLRRVALPDVLAGFSALVETAMAWAQRRLAIDPDDGAAYLQRAKVHSQARNHLASLEDYDRALALDASDIAAHMARGNVLCNLGRFDEALDAYDRILALDGGNALACYNRGNVLQKLGRLDAALHCYRRATAIVPEFAEAWLEQAHCRLAQGEFAEGWWLYEARWRTAQLAPTQLASTQPRWLGGDGIAGRTILLWAEQGYGDTIQFARFAAGVADLGAKVILRLPQALLGLLSTLDTRIAIVGDGEPLPPHDCHCPLMSLPLALGVASEAALAGAPYLRADASPSLTQARPGPGTGQAIRPRVGLCWAGRQAGAAGAYNPGRDIPPAALMALAGVNADFVSLQKDGTDALPAFVQVAPALDDFGATAAVIASLDLVISVDTAIAHLAGALGKPCWLLLKRSGEWRWQSQRDDTPWYPSVKIFRQQTEGDWSEPLRRVAASLTPVR